jgi:hypothetical protein
VNSPGCDVYLPDLPIERVDHLDRAPGHPIHEPGHVKSGYIRPSGYGKDLFQFSGHDENTRSGLLFALVFQRDHRGLATRGAVTGNVIWLVGVVRCGIRRDNPLQAHALAIHGEGVARNVAIAKNPGDDLQRNLKHEQFYMEPIRLIVGQDLFNPGEAQGLIFKMNQHDIVLCGHNNVLWKVTIKGGFDVCLLFGSIKLQINAANVNGQIVN